MSAASPRLYATIAAVLFAVSACTDQRTLLAPESVGGRLAVVQGPAVASAAAPSPAQRNYEIKFMQDMIDHHMMAIMISELCLKKAVHEELRALCADIIAAQRAEIEQMQTWLQTWHGIAYQPTIKPADERMMERMAMLSPAEFEVEYMEMMIRHHRRAVKEGKHCLDKAYHAELKALCEDIIETQMAEIEIMQGWLCVWYGICR